MWPFSRNNKNTLNTVKVLIVFVPGVMGTRLKLSGMNWDPDSGYGLGFAKAWGFASLSKKRTALSAPPGDDVVMDLKEGHGFDSVASDFYSAFLKKLAKHEFASATTPVYAVGYYWRRPIDESATALRARILEVMVNEDAKRVVVISHSMGGLVSRAMFKQHADTQAIVSGAIHVVQPAVGAVALYRRLFTGMKKDLDGGGVAGWVLNNALGETPAEFATLISVLPGPMQLCPSGFYQRGNGWLGLERSGFPRNLPQDQSIFDNYGSASSPPGIYNEGLHHSTATKTGLREVLNQAKEFHGWIQTYKLDGKTWAIYSTGLQTDVAIDFRKTAPAMPKKTRQVRTGRYDMDTHSPEYTTETYEDPWPYFADGLAVVPIREAEGDGTVPQNSASALFPGEEHAITKENLADTGKHQFKVDNEVEHAAAFKDGAIQEGVFQLVQQSVNRAVGELMSGH